MESIINSIPSYQIVGLITATIIFVGAILWFRRKEEDDATSKIKDQSAKQEEVKKTTTTSTITQKSDNKVLRNVFSVKQQPINTGGSNSTNTNKEAKPFESSYYFAHNKHSTGGGYTDGLKASDYVMNGPRLLSKDGVRIEDDKDTTTTKTSDSSNGIDNNGKERSVQTKQKSKKLYSSTALTKYLWDDDGSSNIAKIHIDTLPVSASSTETITWESAGITKANVDCRLIGDNNEGLYISIIQEVDQGGKRYHLHVPKLYGEADSVKCIVKKHKLLVKLYKKRIPKYSNRYKKNDSLWDTTTKVIGSYFTGKSDKDEVSISWPRLSASSVGGLGGGTAVIDGKIFKNMDTSKPTSGGGMFDM